MSQQNYFVFYTDFVLLIGLYNNLRIPYSIDNAFILVQI